jgi:hypothetical protein
MLHAVRRVHETPHAEGTGRLSTFRKLGTRTDKDPTPAGKLFQGRPTLRARPGRHLFYGWSESLIPR